MRKTITVSKAISEALREEMLHDEKVFIMGEDMAVMGNVFAITKGFLEEFGENRVIDTPISEEGFVGMAVGAAMRGMRPVGTVQIAPLAYMRGRTLDNAFVILDEAQNTTRSQIKMFLTRMGRNAKFIVTGDVTQVDLPRKSDSGLVRAMNTVRGINGIGFVEFDRTDIVRHELVKYIVDAFDRQDELENSLRRAAKEESNQ